MEKQSGNQKQTWALKLAYYAKFDSENMAQRSEFTENECKKFVKVCGSLVKTFLEENLGNDDEIVQPLVSKVIPFSEPDNQNFSAYQMYLMFEFLRAFDFSFKEKYYHLTVNCADLSKILKDYYCSEVLRAEWKDDSQRSQIIDQFCEELRSYLSISQMLKCANYFDVQAVKFACMLALGALVYFEKADDIPEVCSRLGIQATFNNADEDTNKHFKEMRKIMKAGNL